MPSEETPPISPFSQSDGNDHDDNYDTMDRIDENEIIEILEDGEENDLIESEEEENEFGEENKNSERDDAQLIFTEHTEGVLSCAFHPKSSSIVASGGMDDNAYVWDTNNGNKLFTCKGHEDSVEIVSFNHDGNYLATADLNGLIKIWRTRDYVLIVTFELDDELGWLQWHNGTNVLVASTQTGMVYMYRIPSGDQKMVISSFGQNCLTGKILHDGKSLVCGYQNGTLKIVDLKQGFILKDIKPYEEVGGITCLDVHKTNNLIICGCSSGAVLLINSNSGKVVSVLQGVQNSDKDNYIEAVSFCKTSNYQIAASGSLDGSLIIWDVAKQSLRHKHNFPYCINHLAWHPNLPIVFTCHFEGVVRAIDAKSGLIIKEYFGHQKSCLNMSLSSDGNLIVTTSEDKTVRIFPVGSLI